MFMICGAYLYGWIITNDKLPERVLGIITGVSTNPTIVLLMFVLIFLIAGMFIDLGAGIILLVPVLFPIVQTLGIDPIVFGTITVISLAIGLVTPPVGACLFIASEISEIPIVETTKASLPFILGMLGIVILIIFFPQIVLYLPQKLM
jgi:TRAP-type C4-dicarboxylate transport system permease large subunit